MIDTHQENEIIRAFERAGLPADNFDFSAEIDRSLSIEENLSQLEQKTGFKPRLPVPAVDNEAYKLEQMIARYMARGYEMETRTVFEKGEDVNRLIFTKKNAASYAAASCKIEIMRTECLQAPEEPLTPEKPLTEGAKEAPKVASEPEKTPENWQIYEEGREYPEPVKGKDGLLYALTKAKSWYVEKLIGKSKRHVGGFELVEGCEFKTYHEAWLYFIDCIEGKKPECETWKAPEPHGETDYEKRVCREVSRTIQAIEGD